MSPAELIERERLRLMNGNGHAAESGVLRVAKPWKTAVERAKTLGSVATRLATGLETLDRNTRGGFPVGRVIVFGGAPGAGKTTLAIQLARIWAMAGYCVGVLAADEDADGLLVRWGQQEGIPRDLLEAGDPRARAQLAEAMARHPNFHLIDADEEEDSTIESVSKRLVELRGDRPSVQIVDSIQTVRTMAALTDELSPRARVDAVVKAMKIASRVDGHLVAATCELSRGAYRAKAQAEQINDLAAFKESGGIEYGIAAGLVLRSVADEEDMVDVSVPKNRLGRKRPFRMQLDFKRACFVEVPPEDEEREAREAAHATEVARFESLKDLITRMIIETPHIKSTRGIIRCLRDHKAKFRDVDAREAVDELERSGRVKLGEDGYVLGGGMGT